VTNIRPKQRLAPWLRWVVPATLFSGLVVYSQTVAYFGNEPFHLLASQLINAGKKPYLDFFYQHTPLFIYLNAGWMRLFGETWRSAHVLSALLTGSCILVVAEYIYSRLNETRWRAAITAAGASLLGLSFYVVSYGTVGLPFGLCLLLMLVSFRLTVMAVCRRGMLCPFLAGLAAGAAAAASLLTAPVLLILIIWLARFDRTGEAPRKCFGLAGGAVLPFLPVLWLGVMAPQQVFFDIVEYHLFHRAGLKGSMILWNLREIFDFFGSIQGLSLTVLALTGLYSIARAPEQPRRSEFYLCAWLGVALSVYLSIPRPTFSFYFVVVTPFLSILAALGIQVIGTHRWVSGRRALMIGALIVVYSIGFGWEVYKMRREIFFADHKAIEVIAREVNQVTPPNGWVFAFEQVYFEARRLPPPEMENAFNPYSHRDEWLAANRYATVCMMANDPRVESLNLFGRYISNKAITTPNFTVYLFWDRLTVPSEAQ
jgi:hypothetical protein